MPYEPKYKPGDKVSLEGEIIAVASFHCKDQEEMMPMYMIGSNGSWFWA